MKYQLVVIIFLSGLFSLIVSCKKETRTEIIDAPPFASAGTNQSNIEEFRVTLNADSLRPGQSGKWTIVKGLVESKVFFADDTRPDTKFNGMPGENYELKWTVTAGSTKFSESSVKVSFKPLKAIITNGSPNNQTKFYLSGNNYDVGLWTIAGKHAFLRSQILGGTYVPDINSPSVEFQGYANTAYRITWTTHYGSKSASVTIDLKTGNYLESEALDDLQLSEGSYRVGYENGHIVKLDLNSSGIAGILEDTVQYPALQGLTYLKHLYLKGSSVSSFPVMLGERCKDLESLDFSGSILSNVAPNIGKLKKLKYLLIYGLNWGMKIRSLPESIGDLESLELLNVNGIGLESLPESLSKLKNLRHFQAYLNPIQKLPTDIGNLTKLEQLWVSSKENIPASVSKLQSLKRLYFSCEAGNVMLPNDFGNLSKLDTMDIEGNITSLPESIGNMNLKHMRISTSVLGALPSSIGNMKKLETLICGGRFRGLPSSITQLSNLRMLWISSNLFETIPDDINKLSNLEYMIIQFSQIKVLPANIGQLNSLLTLDLSNNQITSLPPGLFDLPKIKELMLSNNKITSLSNDFAKLADTLSKLYLSGNNYPAEDLVRIKKFFYQTSISPYL